MKKQLHYITITIAILVSALGVVHTFAGGGSKTPDPKGVDCAPLTCVDPNTIVHDSNPPEHPSYTCEPVGPMDPAGTTNKDGDVLCGKCTYGGQPHMCGGAMSGDKIAE